MQNRNTTDSSQFHDGQRTCPSAASETLLPHSRTRRSESPATQALIDDSVGRTPLAEIGPTHQPSAPARRWNRLRGWVASLAFGCTALVGASVVEKPAQAQFGEEMPTAVNFARPFDNPSGSVGTVGADDDPGVGGYGIKGRAGHEAGDTVGRHDSITYFDLSPYVFFGDSMLFGEGRLFIANNGRVGGSTGLGLRHFFAEKNLIGGVSFWYDRDDSRGPTFEQLGLSTEMLSEWIDWRTNIYFQTGTDQAITRQQFEPGSAMFVNQNIQFQRRVFAANTMQGLDMLFTVPVPGEIPQKVNLEVSAGWYMFEAPDYPIPDVVGWKMRLDGDILDRLGHMFLEFTSDDTFKNNLVFGIDANYWHKLESRPRLGHSQYNRMASWVRRNRTVTVTETSFLNAPELAINPVTGLPYLVYHVRNGDPTRPTFPAPTGNGSVEMPFQYVREGIAAVPNGDIIFVHANSVFDGTVDGDANTAIDLTARDNLIVLGEGVPLNITVANPGLASNQIPVPTVTPAPRVKPIIRNITTGVPAVTLGNNSRFAGFDILNIDNAPAIVGNGIVRSEINQVNITNVQNLDGLGNAHGISLVGTSGLILIDEVAIADTDNNALNFVNAQAGSNILLQGTNTIANTSGFSLFIQDSGGTATMNQLTITDTGGQGIYIGTGPLGASTVFADIGTVTMDGTNPGAPAPAINIFQHAGRVNFNGNVDIGGTVGNNGDAISVDQLQASGVVAFNAPVNISNRNGHGIIVTDIREQINAADPTNSFAGSVVFRNAVTIDTHIGPNLDPAVLFRTNSGTLRFDANLRIVDANGVGIEITDSQDPAEVPPFPEAGIAEARFQASLNTVVTIQDAQGTAFFVHDVEKRNFSVVTSGMVINNRGGRGIVIDEFDGSASILGTTNINNPGNVALTAVEITNNNANNAVPGLPRTISFGTLNVTNAVGPTVDPIFFGPFGVNVLDNTTPVAFQSLNVESFGATAVSMISNSSVDVNGGRLDATNARGIQVVDNLRHRLVFESIDASGSDFGIFVNNRNLIDLPGVLIPPALRQGVPQGIFGSGDFRVVGRTNNLGEGGQIVNMTQAGAYFADTNRVDLNYMEFDGNFVGIDLDTIIRNGGPAGAVNGAAGGVGITPFVRIDSTDIQGSTLHAIRGLNVRTFLLEDSIVDDNSRPTGFQQILLSLNVSSMDLDFDTILDTPSYTYQFLRNRIEDGPGGAIFIPGTNPPAVTDMILLQTLPGLVDPVPLSLLIQDNGQRPNLARGIAPNRLAAAGFALDWEGQVDAVITGNFFDLQPGNATSAATQQVGIDLDIDGPSNVTFQNNTVNAVANDNIGFRMVAQQRTVLDISRNFVFDPNDPQNVLTQSGFYMQGIRSIAIDLTLDAPNNDVTIGFRDGNLPAGNLIEFAPDATLSTGIRFNRIGAGSLIRISDNLIDFADPQLLFVSTGIGINFVSVAGPITLFSQANNTIQGGPNVNLFPVLPQVRTVNPNLGGQLLINGGTY